MTDETPPKDARKMDTAEYKAAVAELLREARKAEADAEQARIQRAVEAKFAKDKK